MQQKMETTPQSQPEEVNSLDIDKAGYYFPMKEEFFHGLEFDQLTEEKWEPMTFDIDSMVEYLFNEGLARVKYLQAKDITDLGFGRMAQGLPMYQRGRAAIVTQQLLDPEYAKVRITLNSVPIFEGKVKNKSELRRILKLNNINFAGSE